MRQWPRLLRPTAWPIAAKLSAALLLVALLPMICTAYFALGQSLSRLEATEYRNLELLANSTANRLDQLIADTQRVVIQAAGESEVVAFLAKGPPVREAVRDSVQQTLGNILRSNPNYADIYLIDRDGTCPISTEPRMVGQGFTFRPYFREAIAGRSYISEVLVGTVTHEPGMFFSQPVMDGSGRPVGVAVVKLRGETIAAMVNAVRVGESGYAYLIDEDGIVISHPDPAILHHSLRPLSPETLRRVAAERRFGTDRIESLDVPAEVAQRMVGARAPGHASFYFAPQRAHKIAGFAPLGQRRWVLAISEPAEQFRAPFRSLTDRVHLIVVGVAVIVLVLAIILGRSITRPVRALTRAARAVAEGHYDMVHVHPRSVDELGVLSRTFNAMTQGLKERQREREIFGRVLSPQVREKLLASKLELGGETRRVSVLISDIRGFSTISEQCPPQEVVALLNEYLTEMTAAIQPWGGYVNNFIGDAVVVVFGTPMDHPQAEWCAVAAAMTMRERLHALNQRRSDRGEQPLQSGIGISTGEAVAGQIGSLERLQYTVIGDVVNVAARLEGLTKELVEHQILITVPATAVPLLGRDDLELKHLGLIKVKGRHEPVDVYAVVSWKRPAEAAQPAAA